jgi:hypothetical protein
MKNNTATSREFRALIRRVQERVMTYGVVSDRDEAVLRRYTDYFNSPKRLDSVPVNKLK